MTYPKRGYHDIGGDPGRVGPVTNATEPPPPWATLTDALRTALGNKYCLHEQRRKIEELGEGVYDSVTYYEIRVIAMLEMAVEKGLLTREEVENRMAELKGGS